MSDFSINFSNPWLLLLLLPAIGLTLLPYLRMNKHYRRNRNRIASMVLHMLVMVLCVSVLSGISFDYDTPNRNNEIILLVDSSFSSRDAAEQRDEFIQNVTAECGDEFKLGIVKFGYDQKYVARLGEDGREVFRKYISSDDPDVSATDISSALKYASGLFSNPLTAKIVLVSDGLETDGKAASVIKGIAAQGIKVDAICFKGGEHDEVQIQEVIVPDYNVDVNMPVNFVVKTRGNYGGENKKLNITVYDNNAAATPVSFDMVSGDQAFNLTYTFTEKGMHELRFEISEATGGDTVVQNNSYYTYVNIAEYNKILLLEAFDGESEKLVKELSEQGNDVTVKTLENEIDYDSVPKSIGELAKFEQVVLVNVANSDLPACFDKMLYDYVYNLGGGLLTVGGKTDIGADGKQIPHAYNRKDLENTLLQQMLPVQAVDYTPPTAIVLALDTSGSIGADKIKYIKEGAKALLNQLNTWDYCGVVRFDSNSVETYPVTPVTQRDEIAAEIDKLANGTGSTTFSSGITQAGQMLAATKAEIKHVVLVSDCMPGDNSPEDAEGNKASFIDAVRLNAKNGISLSIVGIQDPAGYKELMEQAVKVSKDETGRGEFLWTSNSSGVGGLILEDLTSSAVGEIVYGEEFKLTIGKPSSSAMAGITQEELDGTPFTGYYGTRLKAETQDNALEAPLMAEYVPMFAQWKFGAGKVGSFMSDLGGEWSGEFLNKPVGKTFVKNIVTGLFPANGIKQPDMDVVMRLDNYGTQVNVYTERAEGETVEVKVIPFSAAAKEHYGNKTIEVISGNGNTNFSFSVSCPGIYTVSVEKKNAEGSVVSAMAMYRTVSYSEEYDVLADREISGEEFLAGIAQSGKGVMLEDVWQIFQSFVRTLHKTVDPRIAFLIMAIVLFLLDVAVRKFKFKWIHEIVRDRKAKKALMNETRKQGE